MIRSGKARHSRHGGSSGGHGPLTLIPMIDMLMILVVYLLVHSADTEILPNSRNISIPYSASDQKPRPATIGMPSVREEAGPTSLVQGFMSWPCCGA